MTIVLADDDVDARRALSTCLRAAGHVVFEAGDGGEALALVKAHRPDLLLLDLWMPVLNGLEVVEHLRSLPEGIGLDIVVLSNQGDSDTRLEGLARGVVDFWAKDLPAAELQSQIEKLARPE